MSLPINRLTTATPQLSDMVPFFSSANQDDVKATWTAVLALMQANLTFTAAKPVQQFAAPLTGTTVVVATGDTWLLITPAGTLAALTVTLPADRTEGETVRVTSSQILTSLTVGGAGTTGLLADRMGLTCTLIELNTTYALSLIHI